MAQFTVDDIDRDFFWELVDEGYSHFGITEAYLYMLSQKLSKDTDIRFHVESGYLYNDEIGFKIPTSTITTYDNLLKQIERFLSENAQENEFGVDTSFASYLTQSMVDQIAFFIHRIGTLGTLYSGTSAY